VPCADSELAIELQYLGLERLQSGSESGDAGSRRIRLSSVRQRGYY
jgi:hypothetical protein